MLPALHIFQTAVPTCLGAPLASLLTFLVPGRRWLYRNWAEIQLRTMLEQVLQWGCQLSSLLGLKMEMGSNLFGSTPCCCWLSLYMRKDLKCGLGDKEVGNLEWVQTPNCWSSSWSVHRSAAWPAGRAGPLGALCWLINNASSHMHC